MMYDEVAFLTEMAYAAPPVTAYGTGLVLAIRRKQNHPYSAGLAAFGFKVLLVETLIFSCLRADLMGSGSYYDAKAGLLVIAITVMQTVFFTFGIGLLIGAIFSDRSRRLEPGDFDAPPPDHPHEAWPPAPVDQPETFREHRES
jgi:hypothetical protein